MGKSKIEWTEMTWNPVTGCTKVSEGCRNCYAERMAKRLAGRFGYPADEPFRVTLHPDRLEEPLRWQKPRMVFVCSMGDLFHQNVPWEFIRDVFTIIKQTPQHTYQILTKRPRRMESLQPHIWGILPNAWLGVSVEDQETADERIHHLLETPAAVRFVSCEPLLGPIDFTDVAYSIKEFRSKKIAGLTLAGLWDWLHWVIIGGESGPNAHPMHPDWARSIRDQCQAAGVPFFFKQWGEWAEPHAADFRLKRDLLNDIFDGRFERMVLEPVQLPSGWVTVFRVGKHRAGRLLDGQVYDGMPNLTR